MLSALYISFMSDSIVAVSTSTLKFPFSMSERLSSVEGLQVKCNRIFKFLNRVAELQIEAQY